MAQDFTAVYEAGATNAQINAGGTNFEFFFSNTADKQAVARYNQSFNSLEIVNDDSNTVIDVDLDGLSTRRRRVFSKSNLVIEPKDGIFFNNVKITNTDAANNTGAGNIKLIARIALPDKKS